MIVNKNLKFLRLKSELTQKQFAEKLGLKQAVIGAYEEERATPPLSCLLDISDRFKVSLDVLIRKDLSRLPEKEWRTHAGKEVLAITVNDTGRENVELVTQKASAGYMAGYQDPEFIADLPKISLPVLPKNKTYRAFEIQGDSMLPMQPGSILFGEYSNDVNALKNGQACILVTRDDGIVFKRIFRVKGTTDTLLLVSDNRQYEPYLIPLIDIMEIWLVRGYYSTRLPEPDTTQVSLADQLALQIVELQDQLKKRKSR